ncbi:phage protein Gp27 family protein [Sphingomonas hengshuiensis]|uniref:DUF3486 domain-containing protein n=1 Tax=Sphingomonas hengshuiensis TaxID=1609977 RepID=A0A7U4JAC5_9SPHN|nr:phage protein Gp27 family protein [Sphingomonas hengshuiensis]AJP73159.1 hypothetical protein TS85_17205 [Sphingomonas hengshuiensis]
MARHQPSAIDRLGPQIVEWVGRRRSAGRTIDEILTELNALPELVEQQLEISRSSLGRHVKGLAEIGERMRRSREITESLARMGNRADNKMLRGTIEVLNTIVLETALALEEDEDGQVRPVALNPAQVKALSEATRALASAEKTDADREARIRAEAKAEATAEARKKLEAAGRSGELDPEALARAKRIMGY